LQFYEIPLHTHKFPLCVAKHGILGLEYTEKLTASGDFVKAGVPCSSYFSYDFSDTVSVTVIDFLIFAVKLQVQLFFQLLLQLLDCLVSVTVILDEIGVNLMRENNNT